MAINFCPSLNDCVGTSAGSKPTKFRRSNRDYAYVQRRSQSRAHSMGSQPRRKQEAHHNVISFRFCRDQLHVRVASSPSTRASAGCVVALNVERPSRLVAPRLPSKSGLISHGNSHRTFAFHRFLDCTDITHKWFRPDHRTSFKATKYAFCSVSTNLESNFDQMVSYQHEHCAVKKVPNKSLCRSEKDCSVDSNLEPLA